MNQNSPRNQTPMRPPLRRSTDQKWLTGMCAGVADWAGYSPTWVRGVYVAFSVVSSALFAPLAEGHVMLALLVLFVLLYLVAAISIPADSPSQ
ncbi:PspC domain-containing protein [Luteococcus sp. OSA5]|uniref:PspC domain-containing protein n=1 Tax=Luteococcus sp. OSA5 TaxID=3401630 RepID=UPI003B43B7B2